MKVLECWCSSLNQLIRGLCSPRITPHNPPASENLCSEREPVSVEWTLVTLGASVSAQCRVPSNNGRVRRGLSRWKRKVDISTISKLPLISDAEVRRERPTEAGFTGVCFIAWNALFVWTTSNAVIREWIIISCSQVDVYRFTTISLQESHKENKIETWTNLDYSSLRLTRNKPNIKTRWIFYFFLLFYFSSMFVLSVATGIWGHENEFIFIFFFQANSFHKCRCMRSRWHHPNIAYRCVMRVFQSWNWKY